MNRLFWAALALLCGYFSATSPAVGNGRAILLGALCGWTAYMAFRPTHNHRSGR